MQTRIKAALDTGGEPRRACADCRRLKLKCNRTWPCNSCTRRKMGPFCPDGQSSKENVVDVLMAKIVTLEAQLIASKEEGVQKQENADSESLFTSPFSTPSHLAQSDKRAGLPQSNPVIPSEDSSSSLTEPADTDENPITERGTGNAGLLVILNDGESSSYVGGGATSAHRVDIESPRREIPILDQDFVKHFGQSLPPSEDAKRFCDIYFKHACVEYNILSEDAFYDQIYSVIYGQSVLMCSKQEWAILFLVMAIGSHFDPLAALGSRLPHSLFAVARSLLDPCEFEEQHTMSSVKALHLMGIFSANARARGSEQNWSWLGIQMRIVLAMGLHRDGSIFRIGDAIVEKRRRLFWESQTFDRLHSLSLGRPYAIADSQIDTLFPKGRDELESSFQTVKFRIGQLRGKIADELFSTKPLSYRSVLDFDRQLKSLERSLHPSLQLTGGTASSSTIQIDETTTLPDMHTMRRLYISILLQDTTMCLHRSHFAKAIIEQDNDPLHSMYSSSVVAVMDAARRMISTTVFSWNAFPITSVRWAFLWVRTFSAGVCIGACTTRFPDSVLTTASLGDLFTLKEAFSLANKDICHTERSLTRCVQALDTICLAVESKTKFSEREFNPSLELLSGTTRMSKRRKVSSSQELTRTRNFDAILTPPISQIDTTNALGATEFLSGDNGIVARRPSLTDQTALLERVMSSDLDEYFNYFDQSWTELFASKTY